MDRAWQDNAAHREDGPEDGPGRTGFRSGGARPEILPPDENAQGGGRSWYPPPDQYQPDEYQVEQPPASRPQKRVTWASAPATYTLLSINCLVFVGMVVTGVSFISPTVRQLLFWGANDGTLVLQYGQWWRLVTAMFVHVGIIHIATNMWCLWNLGLLAEPLIGPLGVFAAYILTGFAGNLLSIARHPGVADHPSIVGAGASGAVFGLAGLLIVLLKSPLLPVPQPELKRLRRSVIQFALLNFAIGLYTAFGPSPVQIDNMAHLGGFLGGLALGVPLVPRIGAPRTTFLRRRLFAVVVMAFVLILFAFGINSFWRA